MDPTSRIRKLGFRRWYERELIKSHAALVTCLLSGLTLAAMMEALVGSTGWTFVSMLGVAFAAGAIGWLSWRSYITLLQRAELYGERSNCPKCNAYGRFNVVSTGMDEEPGRVGEAVAPLQAAWMRVECRNCGTGWRLPE
jgi:formate dehydrogenase maturation protein FdhE